MKLFFQIKGEGPPMIILHGLYGSSDNWMSIAGELSRNYTVYIPDQRNHGRSPHSSRHDYTDMITDLEELINENITGKVILLGHSMGGKTAIGYAIKHPETLAALIVADISPFTRHPDDFAIAQAHEKILKALLYSDISSANTRQAAEKIILQEISDQRVGKFLMKSLYRNESGRFAWRINAPALFNNLDKLMAGIPVYGEALKGITGFPVLFIRGGNSDYLPEKQFPEIMQLFPAADIVTLEGTGHWLHAEKPDEFTAIVKKFLTGGY
jgi:esterase